MLVNNSAQNYFLWRFTAVNICGFGLLGAAYHQGWISQIYQTDTTHVTTIIAATFVLGLIVSLWKAVTLNQQWNTIGTEQVSNVDAVGLRMAANLQIVHHIAIVLLLMGISGTMVGIILALKSTEAFSTSDQANMLLAIVMLFKGVYVKFYASLVGIIGHTWILTNHNMLTTMGRRILANLTEQTHARSI